MTAPQTTMATLLLIGLLFAARDHGKPKTGKDNFWVSLFAAAVNILLLYWGGFWS